MGRFYWWNDMTYDILPKSDWLLNSELHGHWPVYRPLETVAKHESCIPSATHQQETHFFFVLTPKKV